MPTPAILGIGNDVIEIDRIRKSIEEYGAHFLDRIFTKNEQIYCQKFKDPAKSFAGRWAAKEAVAKALGTGFGRSLSWLDLEISNDPSGKPSISLSTQAQEKFSHPNILITISHGMDLAFAVAIVT